MRVHRSTLGTRPPSKDCLVSSVSADRLLNRCQLLSPPFPHLSPLVHQTSSLSRSESGAQTTTVLMFGGKGGKGERMREGMCEASPPDLSMGPTRAGNDVSLCRTARINARLSLVFLALLVRQCRRRSWSPSLTSALVPSPRAPAMEAQPRLHVILNVREERQRQVQTTDARFSLVSLLRATPRTPPAPWCSAVCPMFVPPSFHAPRVCMCVFGACLGSLRFF